MFSKFKAWLKDSGVEYIEFSSGYDSDDERIIDSLNPLDRVIEVSEFPLARIYRRGFLGGILDTWHVFVGNHYDFHKRGGRKGILDILIFPLIARRLISYAFKRNNQINDFLWLGCILLGVFLEVIRGLTALILTIILSPVVAFVHAAAYLIKGRKLQKKVGNLFLRNEVSSHADSIHECVVHLPSDNYSSHPRFKNVIPGIKFYSRMPGGEESILRHLDFITANSTNLRSYCGEIPINQENVEDIEALLETNLGGLVEELKKGDRLNEFRDTLFYKKALPKIVSRTMEEMTQSTIPKDILNIVLSY